MDFEFLETDRLRLRLLTDAQYEAILRDGSDAEIMTLLNVPEDRLEDERRKAERGFATFNKSLLIFQLLRKDTEELVGWCGYHTWYRDHARAEIGYGLYTEDAKRQGLMTEALGRVLEYGFDPMGLHRVEALIGPDNEPSLRLVRKFGFLQEGVLRGHYFTNNQFEDSVLFALLAGERRPEPVAG